MKRSTLCLLIVIGIAVLVLGNTNTFARVPVPEEPDRVPSHRSSPLTDESNWDLDGLKRYPPSIDAADRNASLDLQLGKPGLSFRYVDTYGVTEKPYLADTVHINRPLGLFMDSSDNLYVVEEQGYRMLKYNINGTNILALGQAGICYTDDYVFCAPQDIVADSSSNIWIADGNRIIQYDSSGVLLQQFPSEDPWNSGSGNDRFDSTRGIAIDSTNHLFVSDSNNHRIQVFDISGGSPVYSTTIGVTGISGSADGYFSYPYRIAIDSNNNLYVADHGNDRVQKCIYSNGWVCITFDTGLNNPQGITADGNDIYIADTDNGRIRKCSGGGSCSDFIAEYKGIYDVAVDSFGNVYGAAAYEAVVIKYDSGGTKLGVFLGVESVPYLTDGYHYNQPRVTIDGFDNIIIIEEQGQRLLKLDRQGTFLWSVGIPGQDGDDNAHFAYPHGVATDQNNNIYVADGDRVQIFSGDGVHQNTLEGTGDQQFSWLTGIALDDDGNIYVSDASNHRVLIYNSNLVYIGQIGVTGDCGSTNDRLCWPIGLDVDSTGNIYVADIANSRVQIFDSNLDWLMTLGTTGVPGSEFDKFDGPEDVVVDDQGRIYVAEWASRVQVFDNTGAYLTTIGGEWGNKSSQFRGVSGIAVDSAGNVYASDFTNARIQKYAPGVPGWRQVNLNGFGDPENTGALSLASFDGKLFATTNNWQTGAQMWSKESTGDWMLVMGDGFGDVTNVGIDHLLEFEGELYAGTWNWDESAEDSNGGQIWRSSTGIPGSWEVVVSGGFNDTDNEEVFHFSVFKGQLYAATWNPSEGCELWRSPNGNTGTWSVAMAGGFGSVDNLVIVSLVEYNGYLYASTYKQSGAEVWRSASGDLNSWEQVAANGFGDPNNWIITLQEFGDYLYAGTYNYWDSDNPGAEIWRCQVCDGSDWTQVSVEKGFGDTENRAIRSFIQYNGSLFAVTYNWSDGIEVWSSEDGVEWAQVNIDGFGDSNNITTYWDNATVVHNEQLYIGTWNEGNGGEIWQYLAQRIYLPLTMKK